MAISLKTRGVSEVDDLCIQTIRFLSMDGVQAAKSGHPGMPMGMAAPAYTLWTRHLRHNPSNPKLMNRDRFVLSGGHGSMLLYSLLHLCGYDLPLDELKRFRQFGSKTPGHPEFGLTAGVEVTTGPLGQGISNAVGMAIAGKYLAERFNREGFDLFNHKVYVFAGDGDLQEGISSESSSLAGHLGLDNLILIYDDNHITIDGNTELSFTEDRVKRYEAYGWFVQKVEGDGTDMIAFEKALEAAKAEKDRPSIIAFRSHIGFGSPNFQDTHTAHGAPLGDDEIALIKKNFGWDPAVKFHVPPQVYDNMKSVGEKGRLFQKQQDDLFARYEKQYPAEAAEIRRHAGRTARRRSGKVAAQVRPRQAGRDTLGLRRDAQCTHAASAAGDRRFGRSDAVEQHALQGRAGFPEDQPRRPLHSLRHPRACDGRDHERHGRQRDSSVRRDLHGFQRLHARIRPRGGDFALSDDLRVDA